MDHHVDHAMLVEVFGALETVGQLFTDGVLNYALAGKADQGPGSAIWTSPSIA